MPKLKTKILLFSDQEAPNIVLPEESLGRLRTAKNGNKDEIGQDLYDWVAVPDAKGDLYVLKFEYDVPKKAKK